VAIPVALVALGASIAVYRGRKTAVESDRRIVFEEQPVTVVEVLNLGG
jgi:hypothetical protein